MIVEVLAVGTELLLGQIVNSNAADIGSRLAGAGLDHYHQVVVGDNLQRVAAAIRSAVDRADALVITGGIGPTQDDLTREAICLATGREMAFSEEYAERLRDWWAARGRELPPTNLRQAEYPEGAVQLPNPKGTAPGLRLEVDGTWVFALPGVPQEMLPMIDNEVVPFLVKEAGGDQGVVHSRLLRTWGESESQIAHLLGDLYERSTNPTLAFLASAGEIKIRLTARAAGTDEAVELIAPVEEEVRRRLGPRVFGADGDTIEQVVLRLLEDRGWTLATAESATAGMLASRITSVPGVSAVYQGGVVAYTERLKHDLLGVPVELMAEHGVVSEETAQAMAEGAVSRLGADAAVAVTGSAGPEPLERGVGTMVVAVATLDGTQVRTLQLPGDRERVRVYTATAALHHLRLAVAGERW